MISYEHCPTCGRRLAERTNGFGGVYLECSCGHIEAVRRKADPYPTRYARVVYGDGRERMRRLKGGPPGPNRVGLQKNRRPAA